MEEIGKVFIIDFQKMVGINYMFKKFTIAIIILTIAIFAFVYNMGGKIPGTIQKTVVATVGNEKITKDDLDKEISKYDDQLKKQLGADYSTNNNVKEQLMQMKQQYLNEMVTGKIMLIKAAELNVKPSDENINKQIDNQIGQIKARYAEKGQYESVLQKGGMTEETLKESIKKQIITNLMHNYMINDVLITEDEVLTYYNENKASEFSEGDEITPLEQVKDQIKASLLQQKQKETYDSKIQEWKVELKAKIYEDKL
jgi:foldase protein PrsA